VDPAHAYERPSLAALLSLAVHGGFVLFVGLAAIFSETKREAPPTYDLTEFDCPSLSLSPSPSPSLSLSLSPNQSPNQSRSLPTTRPRSRSRGRSPNHARPPPSSRPTTSRPRPSAWT
jgi:hypothetical protein